MPAIGWKASKVYLEVTGDRTTPTTTEIQEQIVEVARADFITDYETAKAAVPSISRA